jgi:two-component system, chemotaxis family, response regulator Rcp1
VSWQLNLKESFVTQLGHAIGHLIFSGRLLRSFYAILSHRFLISFSAVGSTCLQRGSTTKATNNQKLQTLTLWPLFTMTQLQGNLILLAEDEPANVLLIRRALNKAESTIQIAVVADGEQAVHYLQGEGCYSEREHYPLPRLVITDIKMPRMNGMELLNWLKQRPQFATLPVIILSTSADPDEITQATQMGANAYIVRPGSPAALLEMMRQTVIPLLKNTHAKNTGN